MNKKESILIVDDIPDNIIFLSEFLSGEGFDVKYEKDGISALDRVNSDKIDLILMDIMMPGLDGYETCEKLKANEITKDIPVIFMSSLYDIDDKVKGFQVGAVDYITKPIQLEEVLARIKTHLTLMNLQREMSQINDKLEQTVTERTKELVNTNRRLEKEIDVRINAEKALKDALLKLENMKNKVQMENIYLQEEIKLDHNFDEIISQSSAMDKILKQVEQVAITDSTVLITGETGTGKELIARAIHNVSNRKKTALVKVNCAALPANLIESELFGHEKGSFTGATGRKIGRFELADGGSIFLDEIGDLPLDLQVKLLRVLQEGEIERLGSTKTIKIDVRVIAATNADLVQLIKDSKFRDDLYYRLNVFPLQIPPLRERKGDVPLLIQHFVNKYSLKFNKRINKISNNIMSALENYDWHGNVRELENIIERAVILSPEENLVVDSPMFKISKSDYYQEYSPMDTTPIQTLKDIEKNHILKILEIAEWKIDAKNGAAKLLGLPPSTLRDKMKKHGITRKKS